MKNSLFDTIYRHESKQEDIHRYLLDKCHFIFKHLKFEHPEEEGIIDSFEGEMTIELTTYFNRYAVFRYYIPFDSEEGQGTFCTDQLLWMYEIDQDDSLNQLSIQHPDLQDTTLKNLLHHYHTLLCDGQRELSKDAFYHYIEFGRCTDNFGTPIQLMEDSSDLHITTEMHGILAHLPEWRELRSEYSKRISSENIASTKDELVMLNEVCCTAILSNTWIDASEHTKQMGVAWAVQSPIQRMQETEGVIWSLRWPELSILVESAFLQRYILSTVKTSLTKQSQELLDNSAKAVTYKYVEQSINQNVELQLLITNTLSRFDDILEVNLRNTQEAIRNRFNIESEVMQVKAKITDNDKALSMLSNSNRLHQARQLNIVLAILSAASILGLLFTQIKSPFVQRVFSVSDYYAELAGVGIISLSIFIMTICLIIVFRNQRDV